MRNDDSAARGRRPQRILFFVTELGRGGAETQLKRIAEVLASRGRAVGVISLMTPVGYVEELRQAGVRVESLGLSRGAPRLRALLGARRLLRSIRPDLVCCFLFHATVLGVAASLGTGVPLLSSIRDPTFGGERRLRLVGAFARARLIDGIVANNDTVANSLRSSGHFAKRAIHAIPNGLRVAEADLTGQQRQALRGQLGATAEDFVWIHVGNFQAPKDHPNLLRAFERVAAQHPRSRLLMVGLGEPPSDVRAILQEPELASRCEHLGERDDVLQLMQAADALVLSSSSEGLPNVIMEALSVKTLVASTRVGGVPELIEDGRSGFLAPPRDSAALAGAMLRLVDADPTQRDVIRARGKQRILERYELETVVDRWESLFATVGGGRRER